MGLDSPLAVSLMCAWCSRPFTRTGRDARRSLKAKRTWCSSSCRYAHQYTFAYAVMRFWEQVEQTKTCWLWRGARTGSGYGLIRVEGSYQSTHRFAYLLHYGSLDPGLCVCHHCDVRACVRGDHLFQGTYADNLRDAARKGRTASGDRNAARLYPAKVRRGEQHHYTKFSATLIQEIRIQHAAGIPVTQLAKTYGVSLRHTFDIIARKAWAHLGEPSC